MGLLCPVSTAHRASVGSLSRLFLGISVNSGVSPDESESLLLDNTLRNCRKSGRSREGSEAVEPRVSLVTLGVSDLKRAVAFYRDGLG
jgi:hypothetical protein